ncbi:MAG: FtsX-like permease family protein [Planctomycetaceae bacterium]|nr:MAG: FtsX-like permease family protein [Planctomycetaceae bacterium]
MNWVAWKMLTGDRAKYLGTVFGVAFGVLLISQQTSIFVALMRRTAHAVIDVRDASVWVMDPHQQNADEIKPLSESDLNRVRGVPGVAWAVRYFKSLARAKIETGDFRQVILLGLDDHTMVGAPVKMLEGSLANLRRPDAIIVDKAGYEYLWGQEPIRLGRTLEMNDRRAVLVGICEATAPFQTFPVVYSRYSQAVQFVAAERKVMSFVLAKPQADLTPETLAGRIEAQTGLMAKTRTEFLWFIVGYYLRSTGIPINFGITIALGFIVGTAIAGQTFYLFTLENLKQFGALKAMGVSNRRLTGMVLLQATVVGLIGYGLGMGMTAAFFESTRTVTALAGFYLPWQVAVLAAVAVALIIVLASLLSLRKVLVLEPAVVFRG